VESRLFREPKKFPIMPDARAGFSDDSARVARLGPAWRACLRVLEAGAEGLVGGPSVEVVGVPNGFGVSPPVSRCRAAGERQPEGIDGSSVRRIAVIAGLMLFG
jgi:hypothetical protein